MPVGNLVKLDGVVTVEPFLRADYGLEKIYETELRISGLGERTNEVCINYSYMLFEKLSVGDKVHIEGDIRTLRRSTESGTRPITIYVLASSITKLTEEDKANQNYIELTGIISSDIKLRKSYSDSRIDVSELTLQVMRLHNRYSYIPVTCWNNLAKLSTSLSKGDTVSLKGYIQSHRTKSGRLMVEVAASAMSKQEV